MGNFRTCSRTWKSGAYVNDARNAILVPLACLRNYNSPVGRLEAMAQE